MKNLLLIRLRKTNEKMRCDMNLKKSILFVLIFIFAALTFASQGKAQNGKLSEAGALTLGTEAYI